MKVKSRPIRIVPLKLLVIFSMAIIFLGGCGSDGESDKGSSTLSSAEFSSAYFSVVENGSDFFLDHSDAPDGAEGEDGPGPGIMKVFDGNGDGYPDLIASSTYLQIATESDADSFDTLNYYEYDPTDGKYKNKTIEKFGSNTFGAFVRKIRFADINVDGIDDIVFSSNREDGRLSAPANSNMGASNDVFISNQNGGFSNFKVGEPAWSHDVGIADIDNDGVFEILDGNYGPSTRIYDISADGSWVETTSQTNHPLAHDANSTSLADFDGDGCIDTFATRQWPETQDRSYYNGDCAGGFNLSTHFEFEPSPFSYPYKAWNGDLGETLVIDINGDWFAGMGNFWSHAADFDNDGDIDVLYVTETYAVTSQERSDNLIIEDGDAVNHLFLLRNTGSGFEKISNPIENYPPDLQLYWSTVADVNGDGFLDLVVDNASWWLNEYGLNDVIFLGEGDGSFSKNNVLLASGSLIENNKNVTPLDFDQDGIMDFVIRNQCPDCSNDPFILLKGKKKIP
jgi:hypothetical protein